MQHSKWDANEQGGRLNFFIFLLAITLMVAAPMFLCFAFAWGFDKYPGITRWALAGLVIAVLLAALTFHRFFPDCHSQAFRPAVVRC